MFKKKKIKTGWGRVANWYDELLGKDGSYQADVILPSVLRLLDIKNGETVLDLATGQGFFARHFRDLGAKVIASDVSHELIDIARKADLSQGNGKDLPAGRQESIKYFIEASNNLNFLPDGSVDKIAIILALQNIEDISGTFTECFRVLKSGGRLVLVINHPALRVPKESSWGFDEKGDVQFRRVDRYLSEFKVAIKMHPGEKDSPFTVSFHRPLQYYFKMLCSAGFLVKNLEELVSNKKSQEGPRQRAEDRARQEIPLFMAMVAVKN
ncbi:MAG: methyltransferase domain-containing protein [Candidatus Vogelbacteria bacterium]|nr:methyltransferase domain-containing protein [Candidatus Vogelbacteria bacterium]